ncbi:helix-turn-helix transcriptional regulator [Halorarum halobium]|uniref:helix-turn-helix transcriptional regulator n=1 Tax=Halorarum halobium TaxID=3075121 RepID=UPI0028A5CF17|nr:MarR family transcriptional regulator [Halobaculum sp. XH14]
MGGALEGVRFLANSANRVRVLEALADGSATRREVQETTGIPRSTVARNLAAAEDRGWVSSEGSRYDLTTSGELWVAEFRGYLETTAGMKHLGPAIEWLPDPAYELDFRHFRGATVTTPTDGNPTAPFDRALKLVREADSYRGLTQNSLPQLMSVVRDRVVADELAYEGVIEASFLDVVRESEDRAARWRGIASRMYRYDGHVPLNVHIVDGRTLLWLCTENEAGEDVIVKGLLESEVPAVVSWTESLYEEFRAESDPVDAELMSPEGPDPPES